MNLDPSIPYEPFNGFDTIGAQLKQIKAAKKPTLQHMEPVNARFAQKEDWRSGYVGRLSFYINVGHGMFGLSRHYRLFPN